LRNPRNGNGIYWWAYENRLMQTESELVLKSRRAVAGRLMLPASRFFFLNSPLAPAIWWRGGARILVGDSRGTLSPAAILWSGDADVNCPQAVPEERHS
jgi:hypothetical protein